MVEIKFDAVEDSRYIGMSSIFVAIEVGVNLSYHPILHPIHPLIVGILRKFLPSVGIILELASHLFV